MPVEVREGDCIATMKQMLDDGQAGTFDSCVSDPPYHLASIVERFGSETAAPAISPVSGVYRRASRGFMGQTWDGGEIAFEASTWRPVFDLLKPGAHIVAFAHSTNYHRLACAIEDAGFEIRDMIDWVYGSGMPKSKDAPLFIDQHLGCKSEERKAGDPYPPQSVEALLWDGYGTQLKPAKEPICLARKPLQGTLAENVLKFRTGFLNIEGCSVPAPGKNRWPANIITDGSAEVMRYFPDTPGQKASVSLEHEGGGGKGVYKRFARSGAWEPRGDEGSAARFFYSAKASKHDRLATSHPTVKPIDLMRWLCRLVTPPGGRTIDPFAGTGTTGAAAMLEGYDALLLEKMPAYVADIHRRLRFMRGEGRFSKLEKVDLTNPEALAKASGDDLPLFK